MIDYDDIDNWAPRLAAALGSSVPECAAAVLQEKAPRYIEDALDHLFELADRDTLIDKTLDWIASDTIIGNHGSRLTDAEMASVRAVGLLPLRSEARHSRIIRALSKHPEWPRVASNLESAIRNLGDGRSTANRENQVHLTLSRAGLTRGFNHYLQYGSEFDFHVANALLGPAGQELLAQDGRPAIVRVGVPGEAALAAAHPFFSIKNLRDRGELPNVVGDFLKVWSFRLSRPGYQSRKIELDCGMVFRKVVPAAWILDIEPVEDNFAKAVR